MTTVSDPLSNLLSPERLTAVVDIGANPIDTEPPYKRMLNSRLCTLVGFEPQAEGLAKLNAVKSVWKAICLTPSAMANRAFSKFATRPA
jgi:hypothetical protein